MKFKHFPRLAPSTGRSTLPVLTIALIALAGSAAAGPPPSLTWNNTNGNWTTAGKWTGLTWSDGNVAIFNGASAGTVTLTSSVSATGLDFITSETISGTGGSLTLSANPVSVANGKIAIINVPISGSAGLSLTGAGTLVLGATNTYSNTTSIASGTTLQIGASGATGTLGSGSVTDSGTLVFNRTDTYGGPVTNAISGNGAVTLSRGYLTLTGSNSYSGLTTISTGTLQIGDGHNTGTLGTGSVLNNAALVFNRTDNYGGNVGNAISGSGTVALINGNLTLTGTNLYTGGTTVVLNTSLLVNNTSGSGTGTGLVTVDNGAILGGIGRIGGGVAMSGVLAPGANNIGKLTVGGNFNFSDNSTFAYEMNTSAHAGDLLVVEGPGGVSLGTNVELTLSDLGSGWLDLGTTLSLIQYEGSWSSGLFTYASNPLNEGDEVSLNGKGWTIHYNDVAHGDFVTGFTDPHFITLSLTAVPEAGGLLALGCLVGSGAFFRSRRRGTSVL